MAPWFWPRSDFAWVNCIEITWRRGCTTLCRLFIFNFLSRYCLEWPPVWCDPLDEILPPHNGSIQGDHESGHESRCPCWNQPGKFDCTTGFGIFRVNPSFWIPGVVWNLELTQRTPNPGTHILAWDGCGECTFRAITVSFFNATEMVWIWTYNTKNANLCICWLERVDVWWQSHFIMSLCHFSSVLIQVLARVPWRGEEKGTALWVGYLWLRQLSGHPHAIIISMSRHTVWVMKGAVCVCV